MVSASPMSAENADITISIHQQFAAKSLEGNTSTGSLPDQSRPWPLC